MMHNKRQGRAWYHWFAESDTPAERKLILKLDLLIVPYAFIGFWVSYIDSVNISNAWVAGLASDLDFHSNQLVDFQTMGNVGSVLGQLPFAYLFPLFPMNWQVPGMELGWAVFTLLQYRANTYSAFMAYRFLVGFFEASFFPGVHYVLGSWYRADEIARRGGLFYMGLTFGSCTAGLIQSGASAHLDGVAGLAGWRWQFIIVAAMTFPVAIAGFFLWPGTPSKPNMLFLSEEELTLARKRVTENSMGAKHSPPVLSLTLLKTIFTDWKIYVITIWNVIFWQSDPQPWGGYLLWLKSLGWYSDARVNALGSMAPGLGIFYVLFINFSSDLWLGRTGALCLAHIVNIVSMTILVIWNVPIAAKWFAFNIYYFDIGMSSVLYGWANDILRHNNQQRSISLIIMNVTPTMIRAWIGLLIFKTVDAPRFRLGYSFCLGSSILIIPYTIFVVRRLHNKQEKRIALENEQADGAGVFDSPLDMSSLKEDGHITVEPTGVIEELDSPPYSETGKDEKEISVRPAIDV